MEEKTNIHEELINTDINTKFNDIEAALKQLQVETKNYESIRLPQESNVETSKDEIVSEIHLLNERMAKLQTKFNESDTGNSYFDLIQISI